MGIMELSNRSSLCAVRAKLRILGTSDLHLHLLPWDYYADRPMAATGLAQAARLIRSLRAGAGTTLLFDNGDFLQGNLLSDWLATDGEAEANPMVAAMNVLGYDAGTLGNHDFNYGLGYLRRALGEARFPVVSANVAAENGAKALVPPWVVLDREVTGSDGARRPVKVGVIGFAPPQLNVWDQAMREAGIATRDIVEAARAEVPRLRAAGAEVVVALCHSGIGAAEHEPLMENAAVPLAAVDGVDAVIAGHTHLAFPGEAVPGSGVVDPVAGLVHGKPTVQPGFHGSHVGVLDLTLRLGAGGWVVDDEGLHGVRAERVARRASPQSPFAAAPVDDEIAALAMPSHLRVRESARRPVGRTAVALQSYFSLVVPDATLWVVADAQRAHARRLLAGRPASDLPLLSSVSPYRAGGRLGPFHYIDLAPGPLALRQAADLYLYANNSLCVVEVTGAGLLEWLERSAAIFAPLTPGTGDQPLHCPACPSYHFDVIDGLTYAIDPSQPSRTDCEGRVADPAARRVLDLRHDGRPVEAHDRFAVVTNSYRVGSGGGYAAARGARLLAQSPANARDLLLAQLREGPLDPAPREGWRFAALPGTRAWFDSGPGALDHLHEIGDRRVTSVGPAPDGFWRFCLHL